MAVPAAFRRLCVETINCLANLPNVFTQPPSGGCVLKREQRFAMAVRPPSRLQAAVC